MTGVSSFETGANALPTVAADADAAALVREVATSLTLTANVAAADVTAVVRVVLDVVEVDAVLLVTANVDEVAVLVVPVVVRELRAAAAD